MNNLELFQMLWFVIVGLALTVFLILDGFDLGIGMLLPFFSKKDTHRAAAIGTIWPVWDGNELWGLLAGGALFAIFPVVFGHILGGLYPFVIILLVALMYRPVTFEVWFHNHLKRSFWERSFAVCSFVIALLTGTVLGSTISGFSLDAQGMVNGGLLSILAPYNLATGLLVVSLSLLQGATWLVCKLGGEAENDARATLSKVWIVNLAVAVLWVGMSAFVNPQAVCKPYFWVFAILLLASAALVAPARKPRKNGTLRAKSLFGLSILNVGFFMLCVACLQFPVLIHNGMGEGRDITIFNASAPESTLVFLGIFAPLFLLVVAGYTVAVYRIFKGKVHPESTDAQGKKTGGISY